MYNGMVDLNIEHFLSSDKKIMMVQYILIICCLDAVTRYSLKKSIIKNDKIYLYITYPITLLVLYMMYKLYHHHDTGYITITRSYISILFAYIVGYLFLNEKFNKYTFIVCALIIVTLYFAHKANYVDTFVVNTS